MGKFQEYKEIYATAPTGSPKEADAKKECERIWEWMKDNGYVTGELRLYKKRERCPYCPYASAITEKRNMRAHINSFHPNGEMYSEIPWNSARLYIPINLNELADKGIDITRYKKVERKKTIAKSPPKITRSPNLTAY